MSETGEGQIITFYSYKGGTGRTMALANVAWILANSGKRVLSVQLGPGITGPAQVLPSVPGRINGQRHPWRNRNHQ